LGLTNRERTLYKPNFYPKKNGIFDFEDFTLSLYTDYDGFMDNLSPPVGSGMRTLTLALKFSSQSPNGIQGNILTSTVYFTLNQDASQ